MHTWDALPWQLINYPVDSMLVPACCNLPLHARETYKRQLAAQVQVLQLYNLQWSPRDNLLSLMAPTCACLHTLTLCGPLVLDVACLERLPCLRSLSLAYCKKATLSSLSRLSQLRCAAPVKQADRSARLAGAPVQVAIAKCGCC